MRKLFKSILFVLMVSLVMLGTTACSPKPAQPDDPSLPVVEKAIRINASDIEIYFPQDYTGKTHPDLSLFLLTDSKGNTAEISKTYGNSGGVYFNNMLTVHLNEPLEEGENSEKLTLSYNGIEYEVPYEAYYRYETTAKCGVKVKGGRTLLLPEKTLARAAEMVDVLLSESQYLADKMIESGCFLAVYGPDEHAYYIPEHRGTYDPDMRYVEGFGGTTCSITECNVWHWLESTADKPREDYFTAYWDENILAHEFSHGIKISGMDILADQSLANEYQMLYRHAKAAGLWPNSYAISNSDEFFATMTTIWFNVMNESGRDDFWDGVRGPINTRDELYNYDIYTYRFFSKIYPFTDLGENWDSVADRYKLSNLAAEPAVDLQEEYVFSYPAEAVATAEGINYTDNFKILYNQSGHAVDANATDKGMGLWWDYASAYPESSAPMTFVFEEMEPSKQENGDTVYTVKMLNKARGYVAPSGENLDTGYSQREVFTISVNSEGLAAISCKDGSWSINGAAADGVQLKLTDSKEYIWRIVPMTEKKDVVFVHDCTAKGSSTGTVAQKGDEVKLTAAVPEGKTFKGWKVSNGTVADETAPVTTFTMPEGDVVVWALYE